MTRHIDIPCMHRRALWRGSLIRASGDSFHRSDHRERLQWAELQRVYSYVWNNPLAFVDLADSMARHRPPAPYPDMPPLDDPIQPSDEFRAEARRAPWHAPQREADGVGAKTGVG
ncbi:MAG: hypothetical protein IPM54_03385 [Polyangiaceae bacterium]|nr:hypothetical protein [Polyangiaceae bacterium]